MRLDKLTIKAQEALQAAHELAGSRAHQELTPEHVLAALLDQPEGIAGAILRKLGVDPARVRQSVAEALDAQPQVSGAAGEEQERTAAKSRQAEKRKAKSQRASSSGAPQPSSSPETSAKDPTSTGGQS